MATGDDTVASEDQSSIGNTTYTFDVPDTSVRPLQPPSSRYSAGPRSSRDGRFSEGADGDDFGVLNNEHFDTVARDMQTELYEARIITCEKEIEALHRNLQKERTLVASLKAQLTTQQEQAQHSTATAGKPAQRSSSVSAVQRGPRPSEEPTIPAAADTSQLPPTQAGELSRARIATRRGSTGSIERTSTGIPTFAPSVPSAGASSAAVAPDTINDFSQDYVVPENPSTYPLITSCLNV